MRISNCCTSFHPFFPSTTCSTAKIARVVCNRNQVSVWRTETKMSSLVVSMKAHSWPCPRRAGSPAHIESRLILTYLAVLPNVVFFYILWLFHQYFQCGLHMYCGLFPCCLLPSLSFSRHAQRMSMIRFGNSFGPKPKKKWFRSLAMLESVYEKVTSLTPLWAKSPPNFLHTFARLKSWQATSYPISRQFLNDLWGLHTVHLFQFSWNVKKSSPYVSRALK